MTPKIHWMRNGSGTTAYSAVPISNPAYLWRLHSTPPKEKNRRPDDLLHCYELFVRDFTATILTPQVVLSPCLWIGEDDEDLSAALL